MKIRFPIMATLCTLMTLSNVAGADPIQLFMERDQDVSGGGNELAILDFDSIAEIVAANDNSTTFSNVNISSGSSTTGATWDGSLYHLFFERDIDTSGGSEFAIQSYNSIADIISFNPIETLFSAINVSIGWSTTGATWAAGVYYLMFERDTDVPGGNELAFQSYNSIADLVAFNPIDTFFSSINVSSAWSTTGITYESDTRDWHIAFETDSNRTGGFNEFAIQTYDNLADIISFNPATTAFSEYDFSGNFSSTALVASPEGTPPVGDPDKPPGGEPVPVSETGTLALLSLGLLLVGLFRRERSVIA